MDTYAIPMHPDAIRRTRRKGTIWSSSAPSPLTRSCGQRPSQCRRRQQQHVQQSCHRSEALRLSTSLCTRSGFTPKRTGDAQRTKWGTACSPPAGTFLRQALTANWAMNEPLRRSPPHTAPPPRAARPERKRIPKTSLGGHTRNLKSDIHPLKRTFFPSVAKPLALSSSLRSTTRSAPTFSSLSPSEAMAWRPLVVSPAGGRPAGNLYLGLTLPNDLDQSNRGQL